MRTFCLQFADFLPTKEAAMDLFWQQVEKNLKSGPMLKFGVVYDETTMQALLSPGFTPYPIVTDADVEVAYTSAVELSKKVFFIDDEWHIGLDIRCGSGAKLVCFAEVRIPRKN